MFSHKSEHDPGTLVRQKTLNKTAKFWRKEKEKEKETTCAPFCALAAKNKLDIEKEKKAQGYRLTKPHWGGRRWGAVDGAGGEEQASGRSYVRGHLYGLYSRVLHPSGFKSDRATGTQEVPVCEPSGG